MVGESRLNAERRPRSGAISATVGGSRLHHDRDGQARTVSSCAYSTLRARRISQPGRGSRRRFEYTLVDLLVLRATRTLLDARVGPGRSRASSASSRAQLGAGRDVASVTLSRDGTEIVASDGRERWHPKSGQLLLGFAGERAAPVIRAIDGSDGGSGVRGVPPRARARRRLARRRAKRLSTGAASRSDRRVRRWSISVASSTRRASTPPRSSTTRQRSRSIPRSGTAAFNLAILAENQGRARLAVRRYRQVLQIAPDMADAHQRLARLLAGLGDHVAARRHMRCYRELHRHKRR